MCLFTHRKTIDGQTTIKLMSNASNFIPNLAWVTSKYNNIFFLRLMKTYSPVTVCKKAGR